MFLGFHTRKALFSPNDCRASRGERAICVRTLSVCGFLPHPHRKYTFYTSSNLFCAIVVHVDVRSFLVQGFKTEKILLVAILSGFFFFQMTKILEVVLNFSRGKLPALLEGP